ncbi:MAG: hypothetical protein AB7K36_24175 [Chloroflexota bacterium]
MYSPQPEFVRWDADDALDSLHRAGLDIDHVEQARWPASAPQPRTQRQAFTFRSVGAVDPHLLLVFDSVEALEAWRLWLARYWRARPYLSIHDNVLLLVSRDLPEAEAARFHRALEQMRMSTPVAAPSPAPTLSSAAVESEAAVPPTPPAQPQPAAPLTAPMPAGLYPPGTLHGQPQ